MTGYVSVEIERIYLDQDNPRHEPFTSEAEAIEYLCAKEQVLGLARDIATFGLNPLEVFGFYKAPKSTQTRTELYTAAEGNRRLCALKLLHDPDLAPKEIRNEIEELTSDWNKIDRVTGVVFDTHDEAKIWLDRIHGGLQNGAGRRTWTAEQKERFSGGSRNKIALEILDYAQKNGFITAEDRGRRLTTAQRFLSNVIFKEELGITVNNGKDIQVNRPKEEFNILVRKFIIDLLDGSTVNSRALKPTIDEYARSLRSTPGVSVEKCPPIPLSNLTVASAMETLKAVKAPSPTKPPKGKYIPYEEEIADKLGELGNHKLISLYYSICKIPLADHTPVIAIAIWAFIESLSAIAGRDERTAFDAFFTAHRMSGYGLGDKNKTKQITQAIKRISENGNATKHHTISAEYNDAQLINDMATVKPLMVACINSAIKLNTRTT